MIKSNTTILTKNWCVCILAVFCCLLWGSAFPSIKIGYELFQIPSSDIATQILFAGYRFALAGIIVVIIGSFMKGQFLLPSRSSIPKIVKICLLQTVVQYFFFYIGMAHTTGVKGSIITASNAFISIIFSSLIFKLETLDFRKILGCIVGFAGVVIINLSGSSTGVSFNLIGDGFIVLSTSASALAAIFMKRYSQNDDPVLLSGYQFMFGGIIMAVLAYIAGGRLHIYNLGGLLLLFYLALLSAVAYTIWGILLKHNPISKVTVFGFSNPVFGVILSTLILKEGNAFGMRAVIALLLVCIGIFIVNYKSEKHS